VSETTKRTKKTHLFLFLVQFPARPLSFFPSPLLVSLRLKKNKKTQVAGLLTEIVTNNAAAALVYPVAARLGDALGVEPVVMASAVMLGASDAFVSPFGYQCNLMGEGQRGELFSFGVFGSVEGGGGDGRGGRDMRASGERRRARERFLVRVFFFLQESFSPTLPPSPLP